MYYFGYSGGDKNVGKETNQEAISEAWVRDCESLNQRSINQMNSRDN